jgi:hypothetical protein
MAGLLSDKGLNPMYATTLAKIEAGARSVRINEAVAIADLFEVSLDTLLGRKPGVAVNDTTFALRALHGIARRTGPQVWELGQELQNLIDDTFGDLDFRGDTLLAKAGDTAEVAKYHLFDASRELDDLARLSRQLLDDEQQEDRE